MMPEAATRLHLPLETTAENSDFALLRKRLADRNRLREKRRAERTAAAHFERLIFERDKGFDKKDFVKDESVFDEARRAALITENSSLRGGGSCLESTAPVAHDLQSSFSSGESGAIAIRPDDAGKVVGAVHLVSGRGGLEDAQLCEQLRQKFPLLLREGEAARVARLTAARDPVGVLVELVRSKFRRLKAMEEDFELRCVLKHCLRCVVPYAGARDRTTLSLPDEGGDLPCGRRKRRDAQSAEGNRDGRNIGMESWLLACESLPFERK